MPTPDQVERERQVPVVTDTEQLARYGVCRARIPSGINWQHWAQQLSQVTLDNLGFEGDGEYAFYRNIMDEPDFPFDVLLENSEISNAIVRHFGVNGMDEVRLDDAFCVHYDMEQDDTSGARHMDPSDITVNICLEKSPDVRGSQVMFYGTKALHNISDDSSDSKANEDFRFLVDQEAGSATIHWGEHPHETLRLESGRRTNIVMTLWYKDSRSQAAIRTCY